MQCWHCGLSVDYLRIYFFMIMGDMFSPRSVNVYRRHNPTSMKQPKLIFHLTGVFLYFVHCDACPKRYRCNFSCTPKGVCFEK